MANVMSMFGGTVDDLSFELKAGKHEPSELVVAGFTAEEALSELFSWRVQVVIDPDVTPSLDDTLGTDAEFRILRNDELLRVVRGIVGHVQPHGARGNQRLVVVTIVPKLAELQYVVNTRIFQEMTVADVVGELLKVHNIEPDWRISGRPPTRVYRVQKNETDYAFFRRILADEGIHFHHAHTEDATKLAFVNDAKGYEPIEGESTLPYREIAGAVTDDHVAGVDQRRRLRSGSVAKRNYDFTEPGKALNARKEVDGPHDAERAPRREIYVFPADFVDSDAGKSLAQRRLEEARSDALTFSGKSSSVRMEAGRTFTLEQHPEDSFNRELLVTRTTITGRKSGILADTGGGGGPGFSVTFAAVPSEVPLRPRQLPPPATHPESARIVGPTSGSPFIDKYGRVKVQFHWDRQGKNDEHSSCWLRVMTPAAGANRGIWFPPRVDDEVIVMHVDGDIDQPFVAGALYNVVEMQPYPLPANASKSTIKGLSIPGGKGHNELTFEDKAGNEEILLHAQRDRRTVVLHNHNETVGANQTSSIGANQTISVGANRTLSVGANESTSVGAHRHESVEKGEDVTIKQGRTHTIETGDDKLEVKAGNRDVDVKLKDTHHAQTKIETIDQTYELKAGTSITIHHPGDSKLFMGAGKAALSTTSEIVISNPSGTISLAGGKVTITAADEVVIGAGTASMSLKKDGTVAISGSKEVTASSSQSFVKVEPAKATLNGPTADLVAKSIATVAGALCKIG